MDARDHNYNGGAGRVQYPINAADLRRLLRGKSAKGRAVIAAKLARGDFTFVGPPSPALAARMCEANPRSVSVLLDHRGARGPRKSTINKLAKKYGASTLLQALDVATTPAIAAE